MMDMVPAASAGGSDAPPPMMMMRSSFYWGEKVQLLFSGWSTQSPGSYILTLAAVFILALFHQWFGELKKGLFHLSSSSSSPSPPSNNSKPSQSQIATSFNNFLSMLLRHRAIRIFLLTGTHILIATSGYLLMLIVMSFNIGVFLSVLAGLAFGFILFET